MKYLILFSVIWMVTGCISYHRIECGDIDPEDCKQAIQRCYEAFVCFNNSKDINELLYFFGDSKPIVSLKSSDAEEGYRFLLLRSFNGPVLITVSINNNRAQLNLRVSDNSGCFFPILIKNKTIQLTKQQLQHLRNVVQENQFWEGKLSDVYGRDGADWIIEIKQQGIYHFGKEWSPDQGAIRNIGFCLLELSKYGLDEDPIYTKEDCKGK